MPGSFPGTKLSADQSYGWQFRGADTCFILAQYVVEKYMRGKTMSIPEHTSASCLQGNPRAEWSHVRIDM